METHTISTLTGTQEGCTPSFLDADAGSVLGHEVRSDGFASGDLHLSRFSPRTAESGPPVTAW